MLRLLNKLFLFFHEPMASIEAREIALSVQCKTAMLKRVIRAESGEAEFQFRLAQMYLYDLNYIGQDIVTAIFWYKKAAKQGHERAKRKLFMLRAMGEDD